MNTLHTLLNVPPDAAIVIKQVELVDWGRGLIFLLRADEKDYELRFEDCREMRWRIYAHETSEAETPIVDFAPGRDAHRSPAQILAGSFGLSLWYGEMRVLLL